MELCGDCESSLPVLNRHVFSNPAGNSIGKILCAFDYEEGIRRAIHHLKFRDKPGNAAILAELSLSVLKRSPEGQSLYNLQGKYDIIISVPIHFKRLQQRGYNQSELLAATLAKHTGIALHRKVLVKSLNTPPQSTLERGERLKNLKQAFRIRHPERLSGKRILLVDDVMTTGSTLEECGRVLLEAGALQVDAFVVAIRRRLKAD